jgi:putative ABC transport system permease protein
MVRIAIRTLLHSKGKLIGAIIGVAAAGTLIWAQIGLYFGFLSSSSAFITRTAGDVWVAARGHEVFDNGESLSAGTLARVSAHPCVARARGLVTDYVLLRKPGGGLTTVQVLGFDLSLASTTAPLMPWSLERGLPADLRAPGRIAVETLDLEKFSLSGDPLGAPLEISHDIVFIGALTRGIRPFTLTPYVFADLPLARRLVGVDHGQVTYWVLDLHDRGCAPSVVQSVAGDSELQAFESDTFARITQEYWVASSGIGTVLSFGALLALVIGMILIGQTLSAITRSHLRELGLLKAAGASGTEIVSFVAWQAAFLALTGSLLGALSALCLKQLLMGFGLSLILSPAVLGIGAAAVILMCAFASLGPIRMVLTLDAVEVLR